MRDIKFRAWTQYGLDSCRMMYKCCENEYLIDPAYHVGVFGAFDDSNYMFMQYTGLKDKNGVEIYEGDIVKHNRNVPLGVVKWLDDVYAFDMGVNPNVYDQECGGAESDKIEVIGNIYENPELLERKL